MPKAQLHHPFVVTLLAAACAGPPPAATAGTVERLLVCQGAANTLALLDPATHTMLAAVPIGNWPREVVVAPDGRTAVVLGGGRTGWALTVVDVERAAVLRTISLAAPGGEVAAPRGRGPTGLTFVAPRQVLVVGVVVGRRLLVDLDRGGIELRQPQGVEGGGVDAGVGAGSCAIDPARGALWSVDAAAATLTIAASGAATRTIVTGEQPFRITFTPDGALALVSCTEAGVIEGYDAASGARVFTIPIAGDTSELSALPMGLAVAADGRRAYVGCARGEYVAVIDLAQRCVIDRIVVPGGPDGVAFARCVPRALSR